MTEPRESEWQRILNCVRTLKGKDMTSSGSAPTAQRMWMPSAGSPPAKCREPPPTAALPATSPKD